jgi:hypothetical protein
VRSTPIALAVVVVAASLALALDACLVSVDESLVDRATAPKEAGVSEAGTSGGDAAAAAPEASVYAGMPCGKSGHCFPSAGQVCCTGGDGDPAFGNGSCGKDQDCQTGDFFRCMGPADCADALGQPAVCCATDFSGGGFSNSSCKAACAAGDVELCDPQGPACPTPRTCTSSAEYVGLHACQ